MVTKGFIGSKYLGSNFNIYFLNVNMTGTSHFKICYNFVDTTTGGLLVPAGITSTVVVVSSSLLTRLQFILMVHW